MGCQWKAGCPARLVRLWRAETPSRRRAWTYAKNAAFKSFSERYHGRPLKCVKFAIPSVEQTAALIELQIPIPLPFGDVAAELAPFGALRFDQALEDVVAEGGAHDRVRFH